MIKTKDLVPEVYYNKSRDFQLLGRVYEIVFNYLKNNIDIIYNNPYSKNSDKRFLDLLSLTLGFKLRHNYDTNQLAAICSAFSEILRNKGSQKSIELILNALLYSEGINESGSIQVEYDEEFDGQVMNIYIPASLSNFTLLNDLLDYVLPAGMTTVIVEQRQITREITNEFKSVDTFESATKKATTITSIIPQADYMPEPADTEGGTINNTVIAPYSTISPIDASTDAEEGLFPKGE